MITKPKEKTIDLFVPGRLCLFGEHTDWAGRYMAQNAEVLPGMSIVTGINLGIYADAKPSDEFVVHTLNAEGEMVSFACEMHRETLKQEARNNAYFGYCCGVAAYLRENYRVGGIELNITKMTLPMKKGLSSSAAICVLVAKAFNELYQLNLSVRGIMQVAYMGERLTLSRCGRLDQACAYGETPVVMEFSDEEIKVEKIRVGKTLHWVFADLCANKNTKKILTDLNSAYPFAQDERDKAVQEALGKDNHLFIRRACAAMNSGDVRELGRIMCEAQLLFDEKVAPACPEELTAPILHEVLHDECIQQWIYGGKGVGSQGDGTVQFLAKDKEAQAALVEYLNEVRKLQAYAFDIRAGGKVRKAIIPIAGLGTRMYPQTHFIKKAFLPIIDEKGVVKPIIMCMIEEALDAGIEEIIIIVDEGQTEEYAEYFSPKNPQEFALRLPENLREEYLKISYMGKHLRFVEQKEKKGLGHAVYQAKPYLSNEPVLLMLGDFIYKSHLDISCTQQTINAYNKSGGKAVVSIKAVPINQSSTYGIVKGTFEADRTYLMSVQDMVEKPSEDYARENLLFIDSDGRECCYATFGEYVLTKEIFDYLGEQIKVYEEDGVSEEVDLTAALRSLALKKELEAVDIAGESFDVGIPSMYYDTFSKFPQK